MGSVPVELPKSCLRKDEVADDVKSYPVEPLIHLQGSFSRHRTARVADQ